jgi:hypothetical protein
MFNVIGGLWPLVSLRSFEKIFGPKTDEWLVHTVGGLMIATGWAQLGTSQCREGHRLARRLGLGSALTLLTVDLIYVPAGRLRWTYLLDAAVEAGWVLAWIRSSQRAYAGQSP